VLRNALAAVAALCGACLVITVLPAAAIARDQGLAPSHGRADRVPAMPRRVTRQFIKSVAKALQITKGQGATVAIVGGRVDPRAAGLSGKVRIGRAFGGHEPAALAAKYDLTFFASAVAGSGPSQRNPLGTIGIAPAARILSVRVRSNAVTWQDDVAKAIRYAAGHGAQVIYVNEVGYEDTLSLAGAVSYAVSRNVAVISDEYDYGKTPSATEYPNSLPGVIGAGTVFLSGLPPAPRKFKPVSNSSVLVAGAGNLRFSSGPLGPGYVLYNSFASGAWVTATVALVKSVYPHLPVAQLEQALAISATYPPRGGYDTKVGYGLINPAGALREAARLARLRPVARAGPGVVNPAARLASGPVPGAVNAVRHPLWKLAAYGGAVLAGLLLLALAAVLASRPRRRPRRAGAGPRPPGWPVPPGGPPPAWPVPPGGPPPGGPAPPGWPAPPGG
jgi:hypothetical protein